MVGLFDKAVHGLCTAHADIASGHGKNCYQVSSALHGP
jgi:hypothetical protein